MSQATPQASNVVLDVQYVAFSAAVDAAIVAFAVQYQMPTPLVQAAIMQATAMLDDSGLIQFANDKSYALDVAALAISKVFQDAVATSDASKVDFGKGIPEYVSTSDFITALITWGREYADQFTVNDAQALGVSKPVSDSVGTSDSNTLSFRKSVDDSVQINDTANIGFTDVETDSVVAESLAPDDDPIMDIGKVLGDATSGATDASTISFGKAVDDSAATSDGITGIGFGKGLADTSLPTDSQAIDFSRPLSDSQSVADAAAIGFSTSFSDSASQSDAAVIGLGKVVADATTSTDDVSFFSLSRQIDESVTVNDSLYVGFSDGQADTVIVSDVLAGDHPVISFSKSFADSTTSTDDAIVFGTQKALADAQTVADLVALAFSTTLSDATSSLVDASTIGVTKNLSDSSSATDAGLGRQTDYADITFFAEDFIGSTFTF